MNNCIETSTHVHCLCLASAKKTSKEFNRFHRRHTRGLGGFISPAIHLKQQINSISDFIGKSNIKLSILRKPSIEKTDMQLELEKQLRRRNKNVINPIKYLEQSIGAALIRRKELREILKGYGEIEEEINDNPMATA